MFKISFQVSKEQTIYEKGFNRLEDESFESFVERINISFGPIIGLFEGIQLEGSSSGHIISSFNDDEPSLNIKISQDENNVLLKKDSNEVIKALTKVFPSLSESNWYSNGDLLLKYLESMIDTSKTSIKEIEVDLNNPGYFAIGYLSKLETVLKSLLDPVSNGFGLKSYHEISRILISTVIITIIQFAHGISARVPAYKIVTNSKWEVAQKEGVYKGSALDIKDGFIHMSSFEQTPITAAKYFTSAKDLWLLEVDHTNLGSFVVWEASRDNALFPHLYTHLPLNCIRRSMSYKLGEDGVHILPSDLNQVPSSTDLDAGLYQLFDICLSRNYFFTAAIINWIQPNLWPSKRISIVDTLSTRFNSLESTLIDFTTFIHNLFIHLNLDKHIIEKDSKDTISLLFKILSKQ